MSRIAKKPIAIPEKTAVKVEGGVLVVTGPLGELRRPLSYVVDIVVSDGSVQVSTKRNSIEGRAHTGTFAAHLRNMIQGVTAGFSKKLIIEGTGYKAKVAGDTLTMSLGYSHDIPVAIPEDIKVVVEKDQLTVSGIDPEKIGQFAAEIRELRKPEPYKGKGVRYSDEVIERKQGKKAVA